MNKYTLSFQDADCLQPGISGGKGASLARLRRIPGIRVPDGFVVTTKAFQKMIGSDPEFAELPDALTRLKANQRGEIGMLCERIRQHIEQKPLPFELAEEIESCLARFDSSTAFAIRSSATAEDLVSASFAGQQDTFLNITGTKSILEHISKCWASLYTDRSVIYRMLNGFDHREVQLAVVVQQLIFPEASGILFTADPVTSNRKVVSIDAGFGLGDALVSGLVSADNYKVMNGQVVEKRIAAKEWAIRAVPEGGTQKQAIDPLKQQQPVLTDSQVLELAALGKQLEAAAGFPVDLEWCLTGKGFYIVQSRPITTLFPIPAGPGNNENRVYVSVGHAQMMTDAMKPLGLSFFRLTTQAPMYPAGGRLFVDVTRQLASPESREKLIETFGHGDQLIRDAIKTIAVREGFIRMSDETGVPNPGYVEKELSWEYLSAFKNSRERILNQTVQMEMALYEMKRGIEDKSGLELLDFIRNDLVESRKVLFSPQSWELIKVALYAHAWLNENLNRWLGEKNMADVLTLSVPNNVTSEMGMGLLNIADMIRPYPKLIRYLENGAAPDFPDDLIHLPGGNALRKEIHAFLDFYGMRCAGEIDITRHRWSEKPAALIPLLLSNLKNSGKGAATRKFEAGLREARNREAEFLDRLRRLPDGEQKATETQRMIELLRGLIGYREYPKYAIMSRYFVYKQALMKEADQLVEKRVIQDREDIFYMEWEELRNLILTQQADNALIGQRKEAFRSFEKLTLPRVITSDGEVISGTYQREHLPLGALVGLAVSSGVVEGRARVILRMEDAKLERDDILVTHFTDPAWTPFFVTIKGLVTEAGGLMTHGAVIAREYGLPAVVGVENATRLIADGQRIRLNGTEGYIEIL